MLWRNLQPNKKAISHSSGEIDIKNGSGSQNISVRGYLQDLPNFGGLSLMCMSSIAPLAFKTITKRQNKFSTNFEELIFGRKLVKLMQKCSQNC